MSWRGRLVSGRPVVCRSPCQVDRPPLPVEQRFHAQRRAAGILGGRSKTPSAPAAF